LGVASGRSLWLCFVAAAIVSFFGSYGALAQNARFDLTGPKIEVRVTRSGITLPISAVPNLQPGDRLWLHPALPPTQSVHYLLVLAFLRGTTNPPPENWFFRVETWDKKVRTEGVEITVPQEAQQAVLFLAPVTGGDFSTLRSAVQGRPGVFVRASQDLNAAGFEQGRIEKYIDSMREIPPEQASDPKQLLKRSNLIAATLALKPNADCMKLQPDQQYTCLTQTGNQTLLDDGHGQTIVDALTGNNGAGLINQASYTSLAGAGLYSAYVGSIVDLIHIMGSLHTAQYQYIPAIAFPQQQSLNLRLNTPPSFHNPKSVIVIGLPAIQQTTPPPLRAADPQRVSCLQKPGVVLPVDGAPLVYSTGLAHDLVLHINYPAADTKSNTSEPQDIPLSADAYKGGLLLATVPKRHALPQPELTASESKPASKASEPTPAPASSAYPSDPASVPASDPASVVQLTGAELTGTIKGFWGFDPFTGPVMPLQETPGKDWKLSGDEPVIAGKDQHLLISSTGTACIQSVALEPSFGKQEIKQSGNQDDKETWKAADKPNQVDVKLDVPAHDAGTMHLAIRQYSDPKPATVSLVSYNPPAKLDALSFHAGDTTAILVGTSLDEVRQVDFGGLVFTPAKHGTNPVPQPNGNAELRLTLPADAEAPKLPVGDSLVAAVALNDGRMLDLPVTVESTRPMISILGKADVRPDNTPRTPFRIRLDSQNDLPVADELMFSLKSAQPFPRAGKVEIASPDDSLHATLSLTEPNPSLILEGSDTLLGTLQPLKAFGPSAFGPVHIRAVAPDGTPGEWQPLVTLVRLPTFTSLSCPIAPAPPVVPRSKSSKAAAASAAAATDSDGPPPAPDASPTKSKAAGSASELAASATSSAAGPTPATDASAAAAVPSCTLSGSSLYFVDSIATDEAFTNPTRVPEGFVGSSIEVPPPTGAAYYLRLRDDPLTVNTVILPAGPL
jgi:hypothetical protein